MCEIVLKISDEFFTDFDLFQKTEIKKQALLRL